VDHLLFVLCLVIPFRRLRPLVLVVTAFTIAHSITLAASVLGLAPDALWFPPLVELLIAASILAMALENIFSARIERRGLLAFTFGLIHGFGFSFALRDSLQFAGGHHAMSLLSFNVGVELGQLLVLVVAVPVLAWLFRRIPERLGIIVLSAVIGHTALHWAGDRLTDLVAYDLAWPDTAAGVAVLAMRMAMFALAVAAVIIVLRSRADRRAARAADH
jgi:hypothetical protein